MQDLIRAYGHLTLGSRLRRLGERLQQDTQRVIEERGLAIQASQYPLLAALDEAGPLAVGALAEAVGVTQPGATRALHPLVQAGLVEIRTGEDQRRRLVRLTDKGKALVDVSRAELWPLIEAAVRDLCAPAQGPLLDQLTTIEDGLREKPLARRIVEATVHTPQEQTS